MIGLCDTSSGRLPSLPFPSPLNPGKRRPNPTHGVAWRGVLRGIKVSEWHALLHTSLAMADQAAKEDRLRAIRGAH